MKRFDKKSIIIVFLSIVLAMTLVCSYIDRKRLLDEAKEYESIIFFVKQQLDSLEVQIGQNLLELQKLHEEFH